MLSARREASATLTVATDPCCRKKCATRVQKWGDLLVGEAAHRGTISHHGDFKTPPDVQFIAGGR